VETFERSLIVEALRRNASCISRAAQVLQTPKTTLFGKIRKYDIPLQIEE